MKNPLKSAQIRSNLHKRARIRALAEMAIIAALYATITLAFLPLGFGMVQFRFSEALTILPVFTPLAIPGLTVGCMIANAVGSTIIGPIDILMGSSATLMAAVCTYYLRKIKIGPVAVLAPLPPVIFNALIIGAELAYVTETGLIINILWVALGQLTVCYGLGIPLSIALEKAKISRLLS